MESRDYSGSPTTPELVSSLKKKKNKMENKRRFSDEQIKLLESIFESDSKLEPRKKLQLARELDLQPRQVAIWFQNRRARWKSKQIEKEFRKLKSDYDGLASKFESLMAEKQSLLLELQKLNDQNCALEEKCNNKEGETSNENTNYEAKSNSEEELEARSGLMKPENITINSVEDHYVDQEGYQLLNTSQQVEAPSLAPLENWYNVDPGVFLDQSRVPSQWLNYWT